MVIESLFFSRIFASTVTPRDSVILLSTLPTCPTYMGESLVDSVDGMASILKECFCLSRLSYIHETLTAYIVI
jgi:hypothetical protein